MCFKSPNIPKPKKPPPPPSKLDTQVDALRRTQQQRAGGITRQDTNVTGGLVGPPPVFTPAAGGKTLLGS